jgi:hypothetical protein
MAIHTQESLSGFIASEPLLTETAKGDARFFARIGKEHFRREDDGSFTQTETTYHHLVMFGGRPSMRTRTSPRATTSSPRATRARSTTSATARRSRARSSSPRRSATTPREPATRWTAPRATRPDETPPPTSRRSGRAAAQAAPVSM